MEPRFQTTKARPSSCVGANVTEQSARAGAQCVGQLWTEPIFSMSLPLGGWRWPWDAKCPSKAPPEVHLTVCIWLRVLSGQKSVRHSFVIEQTFIECLRLASDCPGIGHSGPNKINVVPAIVELAFQ